MYFQAFPGPAVVIPEIPEIAMPSIGSNPKGPGHVYPQPSPSICVVDYIDPLAFVYSETVVAA